MGWSLGADPNPGNPLGRALSDLGVGGSVGDTRTFGALLRMLSQPSPKISRAIIWSRMA